MLRSSVRSPRVIGAAAAVVLGAGIGFGAYSLGSAAGANDSGLPPLGTSNSSSMDRSYVPSGSGDPTAPSTPTQPSASPETPAAAALTRDEAIAVAVAAAPPGRVGVVTEDYEETGLRYDVTILHDNGTSTDVEVDTVTGQVTDFDHDDDWD